MISAILLSIGLLSVLIAKKTTEEVVKIAILIVGLLIFMWGLSFTPAKIQAVAEIIIILIIFPICTRCNREV